MKNVRIIQGLMRSLKLSDDELYDLIKFDLENGIKVFDLADIYGNGDVELQFGRILKAHKELRDKMFIQTKCSIINDGQKYYDLSYEHIIEAVNASIKRMNIDYIDSLLLHRPDIFIDAKEVKKALFELKEKGLVKHFGVSNFSKEAIEYLNTEIDGLIEVNQVQLGLGQMKMIEEELNYNMNNEEGIVRTSNTFFYLKRKGIKIQTWSPYLVNFFDGSIFDEQRFPKLNQKLEELGNKYNASKATIATTFLLMLDKDLCVVTGSMDKNHIMDAIKACDIVLEKKDWYSLYSAAGKMLP